MSIERENAILAWHFLPSDGRLQHKHNGSRGPRVNPGDVLHVRPPLMICNRGLHASRRALDALEYASGSIVCRVACWGETQEHENDKLCAEFREVLWLADCDHGLHEFACVIATQALDAQENNGITIDPRSRHAIAVKRLWIKGEASIEELAAASDAAWAAASDAAWAVASDAAWDTAWAAARAAAWAAARAAAWDAARAAAWDAARAAARAAAWDAAWAAANTLLESILFALEPQDVK